MDTLLKDKIIAQGMDPDTVAEQISNFKDGFPYLKITGPATPQDGIQVLSDDQLKHFVETYPKKAASIEVVKFVPASGAASRMFKDLFSFLDGDGDLSKSAFVQKFIDKIEKFAFYDDLNATLKEKNTSIADCLDRKDYKEIVGTLLEDSGLGYGNLPKGLLKFHQYESEARTPAYEHLFEGSQYAVGKGKLVKIHFTVSPEHEEKFRKEIGSIVPKLESKTGLKYEVTYSQQKKSTDTIAVSMDNEPFLEEDGSILFRPAGHGALLENLNDISADLIFIKNIDNVVPDRLKPDTKTYKMAIGGLLLEIQEKVFEALKELSQEISDESLKKAKNVFTEVLGAKLPNEFENQPLMERANFLKGKLNRPIRVCGMVKNTGEPGGGPFWVMEKDGSQSLQTLETAQIDLSDPESKKHFQAATHFNPVDLVCGTRNFKGEEFDLLKYRDMKTGFITEKSKSGRELKALELPGLWNGAMAGWNTLFVEVPLITFNPVKTVNDLLRDEHQ
ncbi:MAG: NAD metabolism ATPase/kinase [Algoriphagus sp.]|nr:NAD metabolism ATPase/kinase [Algoriphagus sp.]